MFCEQVKSEIREMGIQLQRQNSEIQQALRQVNDDVASVQQEVRMKVHIIHSFSFETTQGSCASLDMFLISLSLSLSLGFLPLTWFSSQVPEQHEKTLKYVKWRYYLGLGIYIQPPIHIILMIILLINSTQYQKYVRWRNSEGV